MFIKILFILIVMLNVLMLEKSIKILDCVDNTHVNSIYDIKLKLKSNYPYILKRIHEFEEAGILILIKSHYKTRKNILRPKLTAKGLYIYEEIKKIQGHLK